MENLIKAMIQVQKETPIIKESKRGQQGHRVFNYADLMGIWEVIQPLLVKNNLWFTQSVYTKDGEVYLKSNLYHMSGENIESEIKLDFCGNDIKTFGSSISYYRRYAMRCIFSIVSSEDVQADDGIDTDPENLSSPIQKKKPVESQRFLNAHQIQEINAMLKNDADRSELARLLTLAQVPDLSKLSSGHFEPLKQAIRKFQGAQ